MKILIAPDKFKGSLEAAEVCKAAEAGISLAFPEALIKSIPLADGGEGTTQILTNFSNGRFVTASVQDPLGRQIDANYGISGDGKTAFIEMATASGLLLLKPEECNPLNTSTFGTGELIKHAIGNGAENIILGIGGSATTDGGIGMAAALGYKFYDVSRSLLFPVGSAMENICTIDVTGADPSLKKTSFVVACDVTNPLYGESGAAFVYGPQKGADAEMVVQLDRGLQNLSNIAAATFGSDISQLPGAGAAGGLGAGALWFLAAELREGVGIVMEQTGIAEHIKNADLVITGEGKVDQQTLQGKVVKGLAALCREHNTPLAVICGTLDISPDDVRAAGITFAVSVLNKPVSLDRAKAEAFDNVRDATFHLVRLFFSNR
jgi:glycerate kinase